MGEKIESHLQAKAKYVIDTLFDKGYFNTNIQRDEMNDVENLLAFTYQQVSDDKAHSIEISRRFREIIKEKKNG